MSDVTEDRVYTDTVGRDVAYVASSVGVTAISVSRGRVGRFELAERCSACDVADRDGKLAVATDDDVLVGDGETSAEGDAFDGTGFGPAVAVGFDGDDLLAADPDGGVVRRAGDEWARVGSVDGAVRAIDGDLVAADSGVHQVGDGLRYVGLDDARDVSVGGMALAATGDGLYRLGNGWLDEIEGEFRVVSEAAQPPRRGERRSREPGGATNGSAAGRASAGRDCAHAATADALYERRDGDWGTVEVPVEVSVAGVAYGDAVYAVSESGTFLADAGDGWRSRSLGLPEVAGVAVV
jgi:hypothetical protein